MSQKAIIGSLLATVGGMFTIILGLVGFNAYGWESDIDSLQAEMKQVSRDISELQTGQKLMIQYLLTGDKQSLSIHFNELNEKSE